MLLTFVLTYWVISIFIGLYATRFVHTTTDYAVAGRALPMSVVTATVFATWFGSEAVLGIPATFLTEGLAGIVADPFGSSMCLILVGMFFARRLYRMKLLTLGDFYKRKYGRTVEVFTSLAIVISYLGWVAAQISALGLVFYIISNGAITEGWGKVLGAGTVMIYTMYGGMWSVAITDFVQMIIIVVGLIYIGYEVTGMTGGVDVVINHALAADKFVMIPDVSWVGVIGFIGALVTMMLGSIPQQDVFQRVASAKNERIAGNSSIIGGVLYLIFTFLPIYLAYSALLIDPQMVDGLLNSGRDTDSQHILPSLILNHMPLFAQVMFFGALLSAIKSCTSATLLAPSVTFTENIIKPMFKSMDDKQVLRVMRIVVFCFTCFVTTFSFFTDLSIYEMVENAYKVTLVAAFAPLAFGLYWKKANTLGALSAIVLGTGSWLLMEFAVPEEVLIVPSQLIGLLFSILGMIVGSLIKGVGEPNPEEFDNNSPAQQA